MTVLLIMICVRVSSNSIFLVDRLSPSVSVHVLKSNNKVSPSHLPLENNNKITSFLWLSLARNLGRSLLASDTCRTNELKICFSFLLLFKHKDSIAISTWDA